MTDVVIIDGYNVIRLTEPYRRIAEHVDMEAARTALVADVAQYAVGGTRIVVFDGASNPDPVRQEEVVDGVRVIFSPRGVSADTVIERLARQARERGEQVEVVSDDAQVRWTVSAAAVVVRNPRTFATDLELEVQERSEHAGGGRQRVPIEARIPRSTLDELERLRERG